MSTFKAIDHVIEALTEWGGDETTPYDLMAEAMSPADDHFDFAVGVATALFPLFVMAINDKEGPAFQVMNKILDELVAQEQRAQIANARPAPPKPKVFH